MDCSSGDHSNDRPGLCFKALAAPETSLDDNVEFPFPTFPATAPAAALPDPVPCSDDGPLDSFWFPVGFALAAMDGMGITESNQIRRD